MDPQYPTAVSRLHGLTAVGHGGHSSKLLLQLMQRVADLRKTERKAVKERRDATIAPAEHPHIPNALKNIPSEDTATEAMLNEQIGEAMARMEQQLVADMQNYIQQTQRDEKWETGLGNLEYIARDLVWRKSLETTAYEKNQLTALIKLLTFFALLINTNEVPPALVNKVADWYETVQGLFDELAVQKRPRPVFDPARYHLRPGRKLSAEQMEQLVENMKIGRKALYRDPKVQRNFSKSAAYNNTMASLLRDLFSYLNSASGPAFDRIKKNVHALGDADLNRLLVPEFQGDVENEGQKLAELVQKHGGKGMALTVEQAKRLQESRPSDYAEYNKQRLLVRNIVKTEMRRMVRQSGAKLMSAAEIKKQLEGRGLPSDIIPAGFEKGGQYDEEGNMYTKDGVRFGTNVAGGKLTWTGNAGEGNEAIAIYEVSTRDTPLRIQSFHHVKVGLQEKKYADTDHNVANIKKFMAEWLKDSQDKDPTRKMLGMLSLILYYTSIRVGGGVTKGETTYGLTKLQAGHVKTRTLPSGDTAVILDFVGKSGVHHQLSIKPDDKIKQHVIDFILQQREGKSRRDPLWTIGNRTRPISSGTINNYLDAMGWAGSAKTFRNVRGSRMMSKILAKAPENFRDKKSATDFMENSLKQIGEALGHKRTTKEGKTEATWQTAAKAYINPQLILDFFHKHNVHPLPKWAEKLTVEADEDAADDNEE